MMCLSATIREDEEEGRTLPEPDIGFRAAVHAICSHDLGPTDPGWFTSRASVLSYPATFFRVC